MSWIDVVGRCRGKMLGLSIGLKSPGNDLELVRRKAGLA